MRYKRINPLEIRRGDLPPDFLSEAPVPEPVRQSRGQRFRITWTTSIVLFVLTSMTMFWAGVSHWVPIGPLLASPFYGSLLPVRQIILEHWQDGLIYSLATLAILLAHEMGHYLMTVRYRVAATPPLFFTHADFAAGNIWGGDRDGWASSRSTRGL
jgi:hypothetical protein